MVISLSVSKAIKIIKKKRKRNMKIFNENYKQAMKLIDKGKVKKAEKLTSQDVLSYIEVYNRAKSFEDKGDLKKAADLYWYNIIDNGTDAPANFNRLLIILRKLKKYEDELKIAEIYKEFFPKNRTKINKRIKTIKNKINKSN